MGTKEKEQKTLNGIQSAVLLLLIVAAVAVCIRFKVGGPMIGLFFSWLIIYVFCIVLKIDYEHVKEGAFDALKVVLPTMTILMAIGVLIGTWMASGTIPTIIVYGLKSINPAFLLTFTLVFTAVLSLVTGTSYGSAGSAGVAMMAIGNAMGINPGMVAGAVICGAMFGDKLSRFPTRPIWLLPLRGETGRPHQEYAVDDASSDDYQHYFLYCSGDTADQRRL